MLSPEERMQRLNAAFDALGEGLSPAELDDLVTAMTGEYGAIQDSPDNAMGGVGGFRTHARTSRVRKQFHTSQHFYRLIFSRISAHKAENSTSRGY